jgi:hypothetical protein
MKQETLISPEQSVEKLRETAEALSRHPKLIEACRHASRDRDLRAKMLSDPVDLLRSRELDIPPELTIEFFEPPSRDLPISDWVPFILELTSCRTVWVRDCDDGVPRKCTLKNETLCLGFRLYPNPIQPGPLG